MVATIGIFLPPIETTDKAQVYEFVPALTPVRVLLVVIRHTNITHELLVNHEWQIVRVGWMKPFSKPSLRSFCHVGVDDVSEEAAIIQQLRHP